MFFLGLTEFICLIGLAVSLIGFIVNAIKKRIKRKWGFTFFAFFVILVVCIAITPDSVKNRDTEDNGVQQAVQETESKDNSQEKKVVENIETKIDGIKEPESTTVEKSEVELFADKYGVSVQLAESIDLVLSGMKLTDKSRVGVFNYTIADVKSWKKLDDWAEGERYSGYMAEEHIWYFYIKDDTIVGVRDGNGNIYYPQER